METVAPFKEIVDEVKRAGGDAYRLCYQCGLCDVVCPWNRVRDFSMRRLIRQANFGLIEIEDDEMWRCTTCGTCPPACPRGVDQIALGVSLRRIASEYDVFAGAASSLTSVRANIVQDGNPLQGERSERADWARELSVEPFTEETEILFFTCCYLCYDPRLKKVAAATADLLDKAGVSYGILGEAESCCGESVRKTGGEDIFKTLARENIKHFIDAGVKRILVSSPHCYHTIKTEYPEFMVHFDVLHVAPFLLELVQQGRLEISGEYAQTVAYHDPCYLGRHNDIYEQPRQVLAQVPGLSLVEMTDTREQSLCCGGGGGRIWMDTHKGERFADLRMEQVRAAGAQVLATACPYCITNFEEACLSPENEGLVVKDIAEILQEVSTEGQHAQ